MREDELKIAKFLLEHVTKEGHCVALFDEEGFVVKSFDPKHLLGNIGDTEVQQIMIYTIDHGAEPEDHFGTVSLVFGNEPGVLLSDYGSSGPPQEAFEKLMAPVFEYAQTFEE